VTYIALNIFVQVKKVCLIILILCFNQLHAQLQSNIDIGRDTTFKKRKWVLGTVQTSLWAGSFVALNQAWYANYPKSPFHFYNDGKEWLQMDKLGHSWSTYQISQHTTKIWEWAGTGHQQSVLIGSLSGMAYLSVIEILDGYSDKWGFSGYDVLANAAGAGLFAFQELGWKEQRIQMKLSYLPVRYGNLADRADDLFGEGGIEKVLKDYNGQTYWLSANIKSFFPNSNVPSWLNIAAGYGAKTMLGGYENKWYEGNGNLMTRFDIKRVRRFHLSLDIDLTKIKVKNKKIETIFSLFNVLKIPAPSFEIRSDGQFKFHPLYY
jgi:hypothetical protein